MFTGCARTYVSSAKTWSNPIKKRSLAAPAHSFAIMGRSGTTWLLNPEILLRYDRQRRGIELVVTRGHEIIRKRADHAVVRSPDDDEIRRTALRLRKPVVLQELRAGAGRSDLVRWIDDLILVVDDRSEKKACG